jgi:hypothetical protein
VIEAGPHKVRVSIHQIIEGYRYVSADFVRFDLEE